MTGRYKAYPEYKDAGSEWVGKIPAQWKTTKLKYIFDIQKRIAGEVGYDVLSITQRGIKVKDIESGDGQLSMDYSKYQLVYKGDFAMNHMDLLTGYVDISSFDGVTSPDYRVFRLVNSIRFYDRYYLYLLQFCYKQRVFFPLGQGSAHLGRWRLPTEAFNEVEYPTPSFSEQQQIANFLDHETTKIDTLITKQEKLIELLKEKRQAVISHAVTKGLNPDAPMKDSGVEWLGEVPEHWEAKSLKYICTYNDEVLSDMENPDKEIQYVDIGSVSAIEGIIKRETLLVDNAPSRAKRIVRDGDVIISTVRTYLEAIAPINNPPENLIVSTGFAVIRPNSFLNKSYAAYCLRAKGFIKEVVSRSVGISYPAINATDLVQIKVPCLPYEEQSEIAEYLDRQTESFDRLVEIANRQIELMKERKTALISAAVTGKIDVRDWQGEA